MKTTLKIISIAVMLAAPAALAATNVLTQESLTGDWAGARSTIQEFGLTFQGEYTNTYQSARSGVDGNPSNTSHRFDLLIGADTEKLGLWHGGSFHSQLIYRDGQANDLGINSLSLPNTGFYGYEDGESAYISSLYYVHRFTPSTNAVVGQVDAFELLRHAPFYGGATRHGFMNVAFAAPPSGVTPPAFLGAMVNHAEGPWRFTGMIYDPKDRYTEKVRLDDAFDDGVNIALSATYMTQWAGRMTTLGGAYTYSTEEGMDWDVPPETAKYKYNARLQFTHNVAENEGNPQEAWGIYLRGSLADGNPNILDATFAGGFGGQALFFDRPQDNWGIGYYHLTLSNDLKNTVNSILDIADLPIDARMRNEQGVEAYYAYQATPWLTFTADLQYVESMVSTEDKALLFGLRTNIRF
ncbi:carbohydrate porin [Enterovibrio makurazakiensis]|uniref:carbohydrate porin n=1 Tax=Enterovibrio makurazakiensis TaxID=2910232 RepID=UPI003D1BEDDC